MTAAERKARERARYRQAGLVAVTVWVPPAARNAIHAAAANARIAKPPPSTRRETK